MTTSSGHTKINNERGGKYDTEMVVLSLLFDDAVLLMLLFTAAVWKLLSLPQGLVKLFSKLTVSLVDNNIEKECGG